VNWSELLGLLKDSLPDARKGVWTGHYYRVCVSVTSWCSCCRNAWGIELDTWFSFHLPYTMFWGNYDISRYNKTISFWNFAPYRHRYCQLRPATVASFVYWASTIVYSRMGVTTRRAGAAAESLRVVASSWIISYRTPDELFSFITVRAAWWAFWKKLPRFHNENSAVQKSRLSLYANMVWTSHGLVSVFCVGVGFLVAFYKSRFRFR